MNQIMLTKKVFCKKRLLLYILMFFGSIIIILFILFFKFSLYSNQLKYNELSKDIKHIYNLERIYLDDSSNHYNAIKLSNEISIIGVIQIPKIDLEYPIIEESTENSLKISVCKFSGPNPNSLGNLNIVRS